MKSVKYQLPSGLASVEKVMSKPDALVTRDFHWPLKRKDIEIALKEALVELHWLTHINNESVKSMKMALDAMLLTKGGEPYPTLEDQAIESIEWLLAEMGK